MKNTKAEVEAKTQPRKKKKRGKQTRKTKMATCFQAIPMACSIPSSTSTASPSLKRTRSNLRISCCSSIGAKSSAKIPMPPINPKDPFLSKLASITANSPESLLDRRISSDTPPYLDLFDSPKLMATPAQVERTVSYNEHRPTTPPPDLPSLLLNGRIVYIGMPLVPAVTELVVAELMYLQRIDPKEPIYMYINSTGTTRNDGETVEMETEGFAIYDSMMQLKNEIHTVAVGAVIGQVCLLLAAGTRGERFIMPHSKAMIQQPRVPSSGLIPASDVLIRAKEGGRGAREQASAHPPKTPGFWKK